MDTIGIISTVKAPTKQLYLFVNYHLNIGVDHIILFFDDAEDVGMKSFSQYAQVTTIACSSKYWEERTGDRPKSIEERQIENVNQGAEYLSLKNCNWLIHIDCDELLNTLQPLKQVIGRYKSDVIRFLVLEAVAEQENYDNIFIPTLFRKEPQKIQIKIATKLGCSQAIFDGEYFRGHTASKSAVRIIPEFKNKYKIHSPESLPGITVVNTDLIQLLHFDCVSIDDWKLKWDRRIDGTGLAINMRDNRKKQMSLYEKAKKEGHESLSLLFNKMHNIRKRERPILYILGMLTRIKIDKRLFDVPVIKANK